MKYSYPLKILNFFFFLKKIKSSNFLKDVKILIIGTIISQIIAIASITILSRIFTPNDYGLLALFNSILVVTANIVTLSYPIRIILPKKDWEGQQLVLISILLSFGVGTILLFFSFLLSNSSLRLGILEGWISFAIIGGILLSIINTLNYWFNRNSLYKKITYLQIMQSVILTSYSLVMGFLSIVDGLIFAQLFALSTSLIIFIFLSGLKYNKDHFFGLTQIAKKHKNAPKYLYPGNLLDILTSQLPFLLITLWFTQEMTGYYRMAFSCLNIPAAFFGSAIAQIFYKRFTRAWPDATAAKVILKKTWLLLFAIGLPVFLIIAIAGETIFSFGLGSSWKTAGSMASILSFMCLFSLLHSPTSTTILAMGNESLYTIYSAAALFYRTLSLYIGYLQNDLLFGLKLLTTFEIIMIIIYQYIVIKKINIQIVIDSKKNKKI
jgi:O-antigen/teichoic acid export membrane protein